MKLNNPTTFDGKPLMIAQVVSDTDGNPGDVLTKTADGASWQAPASSGGGSVSKWGDLTGTLSDQTDLQSALDAKADAEALANKAAAIHTHAQSEVTGLAAALGQKASTSTVDSLSQSVDTLQAQVGLKADNADLTRLEQTTSDGFTSLQNALAGKQDSLAALAGTAGQVLKKTASGVAWQDESAGGGSGAASGVQIADFSDSAKVFAASDVDGLFRYMGEDCNLYRHGRLYQVVHTHETHTEIVTHTTGGTGEDPYGLVVAYSGDNATLKDAVGQYALYSGDKTSNTAIYKHRTKDYGIKAFGNVWVLYPSSACEGGTEIQSLNDMTFGTSGPVVKPAPEAFATAVTKSGATTKWTIANGFPLSFTFVMDSEALSIYGESESKYTPYVGTYTKTGTTNTIDGATYQQYSNGSKYVVFRKQLDSPTIDAGIYALLQDTADTADMSGDSMYSDCKLYCRYSTTLTWSTSLGADYFGEIVKFSTATPDTGAQTTTEEVETTTDYYTPCPVQMGALLPVCSNEDTLAIVYGNEYRWTPAESTATITLARQSPGVSGNCMVNLTLPSGTTLVWPDGAEVKDTIAGGYRYWIAVQWTGAAVTAYVVDSAQLAS